MSDTSKFHNLKRALNLNYVVKFQNCMTKCNIQHHSFYFSFLFNVIELVSSYIVLSDQPSVRFSVFSISNIYSLFKMKFYRSSNSDALLIDGKEYEVSIL